MKVGAVAAILGTLLTVGLEIITRNAPLDPKDTSEPNLLVIAPEVVSTEKYYWARMNAMQQEIIILVKNDAPEKKEEVRSVIREMNHGYENLKRDIAQWPNPERALQALTTHYQTQLDILGRIASRITDNSDYINSL